MSTYVNIVGQGQNPWDSIGIIIWYHSLFVLYILCDHPWSTNCMLDAILTALATLATRLHLHPLVGLQFVQVLCFGFLCPHVLSGLKWPKLFAFVLTRYSDAHCWTTSSSQMMSNAEQDVRTDVCNVYIYIYDVISINPSVCSCCWCITPCEVKTEKWLDWQFNPQLEHRAGHAHSCHMLPRISCWIGETSFSFCLFDAQDAIHLNDKDIARQTCGCNANIWDLVV